jgi:hypothetical protein
VEIDADSVSIANPSLWHPKDDLEDKTTKHTFDDSCALSGYGKGSIKTARNRWAIKMDEVKDINHWKHDNPAFLQCKVMMEALQQRDRDNLAWRRKVIKNHFATSRKFVDDVRHFYEHGVIPGEILPGQTMADGKIRPAGIHAPSAGTVHVHHHSEDKQVKSSVWIGGMA